MSQRPATHAPATRQALARPGIDVSRYVAAVRESSGLRGQVAALDGALVARDVAAERIVFDPLKLVFDSVSVNTRGPATFHALTGEFQGGDPIGLELASEKAMATRLELRASGLFLQGQVVLRGAQLRQSDGAGRISADQVDFQNVTLMLGDFRIHARSARASRFAIGWGGEHGFWLRFNDLAGSGLSLHQGPNLSAQIKGARLRQCAYKQGSLALGSLHGSELSVDVRRFPAAPAGTQQDGERAGARILHALLEHLTGRVSADLRVRMEVPVLRHRNALHRIRLDLLDGTIDFRQLESGLSQLEDALLDFSVRDEGLVLELGVPLLPTRGHGKPLLCWPLDERGRELASDGRVALTRLLTPLQRAETDEQASERSTGIRLAEAQLDHIDVSLALPTPLMHTVPGVAALACEELTAAGTLGFNAAAKASAPGQLHGEALGLSLTDANTPLGSQRLRLAKLAAGRVTHHLTFEGLAPSNARLTVPELAAEGLSLEAH